MNVIYIFFTFGISCFSLSGARELNDVEYRLGLGFLELYLYRDIQKVPTCYQGMDADYEMSLINFSEQIKNLRNHVKSNFDRYIHNKYYMTYALDEMDLIANSLKTFLGELKGQILNWHLIEGRRVIWNQRIKLGVHFGQYLKHMGDIKERPDIYNRFAHLPEDAFMKILTESDKLADKVLLCLKTQNVSLVKNKT